MDFYQILGIGRNASEGEIRKAWRRTARAYHPDRNKEEGAAEAFRRAREAYETLGDRQRRAEYDGRQQGGGQQGVPFDGFWDFYEDIERQQRAWEQQQAREQDRQRQRQEQEREQQQRQQQKQGQRRPSGFDEAVKDNRERVDEYERTGEWQAGWWEKWRPGGYGYHERHDKYRGNAPPPPQEPQYTQEQIGRAYGRIPRISYDRPQPLDPVDLANDLRFALLMAAVALFFVSIMMLAVGSWTLEYVVADPLAALDDVGSFIGLVWHRRDIVLQFCGVAAWILALRQISDGLRAAPGFIALAVAGTILFVGGHLIGPPL